MKAFTPEKWWLEDDLFSEIGPVPFFKGTCYFCSGEGGGMHDSQKGMDAHDVLDYLKEIPNN